MKIISIPTTPDLYEEDEREESSMNENEISDVKNKKMELKVIISEIPEAVHCPTEKDVEETEVVKKDEGEDQHEVLNEEEDEKKIPEETKECNDAGKEEEEYDDEGSENTESIQEDMSAGKSTDEDGNTYTVDE